MQPKIKINGKIPDISFLVGTFGSGLLLFTGGKCTQLVEFDVYGITKHGDRWFVGFVVSKKGRIASFEFINEQVFCNFKIEVYEFLSRKIHQMDFIDNALFVTDTIDNKIIIFPKILNGSSEYEEIYPDNKKRPNAHFNSIYRDGGYIYILAHNRTNTSGLNSEIYVIKKKNLKVVDQILTEFKNAHNIFKDKNRLIICNSFDGSIYNNSNKVFSSNYFTRGLSVSNDYIVFGGSSVDLDRITRGTGEGKIFISDTDFNIIGDITIPNTQIMEIRRTDKVEFTLSNTKA